MDDATIDIPIVIEPEGEGEERGRLKRRRHSSHSPCRATSPSRGHDRNSGSRYREHYRKHHRPSSYTSSASPPTTTQNIKTRRRRSDAEPDHTLRGRVRNRSCSKGEHSGPIPEEEAVMEDSEEDVRRYRKRSAPPSRPRADGADEGAEIRRQRSYPNLYKVERRDSIGENAGTTGYKDEIGSH